MSSRRNNVRGPTSALTDFLRASIDTFISDLEQNITPTTVATRVATQNQPAAGSSNSAQTPDSAEEPVPLRRNQRRNRVTIRDVILSISGYDSDGLDEPEAPATKKKKITANQAKGKKTGKKDNEDDYEDDDDPYTALSKMGARARPANGSIERCAECKKKFPVSQYTIAATGSGFLCHPCAKKLGNDPFKKPTAPRKRMNATDKRNILHFEKPRFPTLVSICINIISTHIDDIEAFGDIGMLNMDAISKVISRKRSLNSENVHLFYGPANTSLTLYDATKLSPTALVTLGHLNPNLTTLHLNFCGLISDEVMNSWCSSLPNLVHLQLLGPFLVRVPAWIEFFESHSQLQSFLITQSPRFDLECLQSLIRTSAKTLTRLGLREVGLLSDDFLGPIGLLSGQLIYLDISEPSQSCSNEAVNTLLGAVGSTLTHLNLSGHIELNDDVLQYGILPNITSLQHLTLSNLPLLTDKGVALFFSQWPNPPLAAVAFSRNPALSTNSLVELLNHSGEGLRELNVNGWKDVSAAALANIATQARDLGKIDLGWCREVDDFIVKSILDNCKNRLTEVKVWGCNKVQGKWVASGTKTKAKIFGIERAHTSIT
ncbi:RNI-like protein [Lentinula lateritia]|uniref:RNI-like protein n=1 Tax=Lentinula aff. lateritia TaxID=2804960 RepID=A0ACC1TRD7_9AGAR|nr:RNI-like protein [Lentinula aff. lateritia]KAJ3857766.1 RNI-like protein [Lentinula lateritia]